MNVQVVGCSHHGTSIVIRERLAFGRQQAEEALRQWRLAFRDVEGVLLSTCNRVEIYAASESAAIPGVEEIGGFLARFHQLDASEIVPHLFVNTDEAAVRHLFGVAASLDSMVLGEPQILAQVKQAYQAATEREATGPLLHMAFQAAIRVARRVTTETAIHQRRVSIPSVAVADFARQIFERFDDKETLVIGAGEMAEETLRYLRDEGARRITVVNRSFEHAIQRARQWQGQARPWEELHTALSRGRPGHQHHRRGKAIVTLDEFRPIHAARGHRPLFILDLAVPRDFDPAIGDCSDVYLYSVDDLQAACQNNRLLRDKELPAAQRIVDQETRRFMAEMYHRATGPVIQQLRDGWHKPKEEELRRLMNRLPNLEQRADEIRQSFDRLVNKLLAPASGIVARRVARRRPAWIAGRLGAVVSTAGLSRGWTTLRPLPLLPRPRPIVVIPIVTIVPSSSSSILFVVPIVVVVVPVILVFVVVFDLFPGLVFVVVLIVIVLIFVVLVLLVRGLGGIDCRHLGEGPLGRGHRGRAEAFLRGFSVGSDTHVRLLLHLARLMKLLQMLWGRMGDRFARILGDKLRNRQKLGAR